MVGSCPLQPLTSQDGFVWLHVSIKPDQQLNVFGCLIYTTYNYLFSILVSSPPLRHFIEHLVCDGAGGEPCVYQALRAQQQHVKQQQGSSARTSARISRPRGAPCAGPVTQLRTKMRERQRRATTGRILAGLRQHGNINKVIAALAREAGWSSSPTAPPSPLRPPPPPWLHMLLCSLCLLSCFPFLPSLSVSQLGRKGTNWHLCDANWEEKGNDEKKERVSSAQCVSSSRWLALPRRS